MTKLSEMPVVTVEQIVRFRDAAMEIERQRDELLTELELAKTDAHNKSLRIQELHSRNAEMKAKIEDMAKGEDDGIR